MVREPELEHVGLEACLQGQPLLLFEAEELVVGPDRRGERVELAVDLFEGKPADQRPRAERQRDQKNRRDDGAREGDAGTRAPETGKPHRRR